METHHPTIEEIERGKVLTSCRCADRWTIGHLEDAWSPTDELCNIAEHIN